MLAKLTSKNRLTLPKSIVAQLGEFEYVDVRVEGDSIVLTPVPVGAAQAVRDKLVALGISEADVEAAAAWAREG